MWAVGTLDHFIKGQWGGHLCKVKFLQLQVQERLQQMIK